MSVVRLDGQLRSEGSCVFRDRLLIQAKQIGVLTVLVRHHIKVHGCKVEVLRRYLLCDLLAVLHLRGCFGE